MNSSELYDTLVSLDEKYTEEAETFLFTNKGDFTKNAQCKGIKTNRLTGVAVSIAIIPLLAAITVFSVVIIKNNTRKKSETTKADDVETIGNTGIRFKDLTEMTKDEILESDEALLWFMVLSADERHDLIGYGQKCNSYDFSILNISKEVRYSYDSVVPENIEAFFCSDGTMVVFGDSAAPGNYKYCLRYNVQWQQNSVLNPKRGPSDPDYIFTRRVLLAQGMFMPDKIGTFCPIPYSSFSEDYYGNAEVKFIYCTRYKSDVIPEGVSMSPEALEDLYADKDSLNNLFAEEKPSIDVITRQLGSPDAVCDNVRQLNNNPEFHYEAYMKDYIETFDDENGFEKWGGSFISLFYNSDITDERLAVLAKKELDSCESVYYRQFLSEIPGNNYGKTYYYYDGWLKIVFDSCGNYMYSLTVEPIAEYTDEVIINIFEGKWQKGDTLFAVPHSDKYIDILLNANK